MFVMREAERICRRHWLDYPPAITERHPIERRCRLTGTEQPMRNERHIAQIPPAAGSSGSSSRQPAQRQEPASLIVREGTFPFPRRITQNAPAFITDEILPPGALLEFVSVDVLNCYINYVELRSVITERDPEEEERHISISNRFYTHFHEFGTVIHVIGASALHWWYFCYDIDASDCAIGRVETSKASLAQMVDWVRTERISGRYPVVDIDVMNLRGWRSFQ